MMDNNGSSIELNGCKIKDKARMELIEDSEVGKLKKQVQSYINFRSMTVSMAIWRAFNNVELAEKKMHLAAKLLALLNNNQMNLNDIKLLYIEAMELESENVSGEDLPGGLCGKQIIRVRELIDNDFSIQVKALYDKQHQWDLEVESMGLEI